MANSIPKGTEAVVIVLDLVNHTLARKVRTEETRRFGTLAQWEMSGDDHHDTVTIKESHHEE